MQSRLPNKKVLLEFLSLYKTFRQPLRNSLFSYAKQQAGIALSSVGYVPVENKLDQIVTQIESTIKSAAIFDDYYELIFTLRTKAEEAQALKTLSDESLLRGTLHALANIIISDLAETEDFYKKVGALKAEVKESKDKIQWCLQKRHGRGVVSEYEPNLDIAIKKLAYLGDGPYCYKARRLELLEHFPLVSENDIVELTNNKHTSIFVDAFNHAIPLVLQPRHGRLFYALHYQKNTEIDYNRFEENARNKPENQIEGKEQLNNISEQTPVNTTEQTQVKIEEKDNQVNVTLSPLPANPEKTLLPPDSSHSSHLARVGFFKEGKQPLVNPDDVQVLEEQKNSSFSQ